MYDIYCIYSDSSSEHKQAISMLMVRTEMVSLTFYVQFAYKIPPSLCMGRKTMDPAICQVGFLNHVLVGWFLL